MALVKQRIDNLLGGVSQLPEHLRPSNQVTEMVNAVPSLVHGLMHRPPLTDLRALPGTTDAGYTNAYEHLMEDVDGQTYRVIVAGGEVRVFNAATGAEVTVEGGARPYLTNALDIRAVTVGRSVYLTNPAVAVSRDVSDAPEAPLYDGMFVVEQTSSGDVTGSFTVQDVTIGGTAAVTYDGPEDLVSSLYALFTQETTGLDPALYDVVARGPVLYFRRKDGKDFRMSVSNLNGASARVIKGTVGTASDLPANGYPGIAVRVLGEPGSDIDDFYVRYEEDPLMTSGGSWKEISQPGEPGRLDGSTLPHVLTYQGPRFSAECSAPPSAGVLKDAQTRDPDFILDPTARYPVGWAITFTFDWTETAASGTEVLTYTVLDEEKTGVELVEEIAAQINTLTKVTASWALSGMAHVFIQHTANITALSTTVDISWDDTRSCFISQAGMEASAFLGSTLRNLTDGSEGVISSNTSHSITLSSALSGGALNRFREGDLIEVVGTGLYFRFGPADWKERSVGDSRTSPWPSFVGRTIQEVFFYQGRLGMLTEDTLLLSRSGDPLDFFRASVLKIHDDDPIDITSSLADGARFHSALPWNQGLYLFSTSGEYQLTGNPFLTPLTVGLDRVSRYGQHPTLRPLVAGGHLFLLRDLEAGMQVTNYALPRDFQALAEDVTEHVPSYIDGHPVTAAVDDSLGLLLISTNRNPGTVYVLKYTRSDGGFSLAQRAWGKWTLPGTVVSLRLSDGVLNVLLYREDGLHVCSMDLRPGIDGYPAGWDLGSFGVLMSVTLSRIFLRDENDRPETRGRLTLNYLDVLYSRTTGMTAHVTPTGGTERLTMTGGEIHDDALNIPIHGQPKDLTITLTSSPGSQAAINGLYWEGTYYDRSRRIR